MKVIIAGSRSISDPKLIEEAIKQSGFDITEVVCGMARGVDILGKVWADRNSIPVSNFEPDWDYHGLKAGFIRNQEMADYADGLIAVWDGISRGTKDMIDRATKKGLKVFIHFTNDQE